MNNPFIFSTIIRVGKYESFSSGLLRITLMDYQKDLPVDYCLEQEGICREVQKWHLISQFQKALANGNLPGPYYHYIRFRLSNFEMGKLFSLTRKENSSGEINIELIGPSKPLNSQGFLL